MKDFNEEQKSADQPITFFSNSNNILETVNSDVMTRVQTNSLARMINREFDFRHLESLVYFGQVKETSNDESTLFTINEESSDISLIHVGSSSGSETTSSIEDKEDSTQSKLTPK